MTPSPRQQDFSRDELDPEQRAVFDTIAAGPRGTVPRIFHLYLHSPELAARTQRLGAFCRYATGLPPRLSELAILVVAKHWDAVYEWSVHRREALKAGVGEDVIAAIARGETPPLAGDDDTLVYTFASEFFRDRDVSDPTFDRFVSRFGMKTAVELAGILGYYSMLAIALRIFRVKGEEDGG